MDSFNVMAQNFGGFIAKVVYDDKQFSPRKDQPQQPNQKVAQQKLV
jgi:hypothetical protein